MIVLSITALKNSICRVQLDTGEFLDIHLDLIYKYLIKNNSELSSELFDKIKYDQDLIEIKQKAISFATYKPRTVQEVKNKLKSLDYSNELILTTIDFLKEFNYLDDYNYSIAYLKDNLKLKSKSIQKIKIDLIQKGIERHILDDVFYDSSDSIDEFENCKKNAEKKLNTIKAKDEKERIFKLTNFLIYKGFKKESIEKVIKEILLILVLFINTYLWATPSDSCKIRLDEIINSYQPSIIPVISIDGNKIFFDRKLHPNNTNGLNDEDDIWFSEKINNSWTEPENYTKYNSNSSNVLFYLTPDGSKALMYGEYSLNNSKIKLNGYYILDQFSSNPNIIPCKIQNYENLSKNFYATLSYDSKTMIISSETRKGFGELDLYVTFFNEKQKFWTEPINLGNKINSKFSEGSPFLSYDKKTIYFASTRDGGLGLYDIYYSTRLDDTWENWTEPKNLGVGFNSRYDENSIWVNATGDTAFVVSSDSNIARQGIYRICIPNIYKPQAYNLIKLKIKGNNDQRSLNFLCKEIKNAYEFTSNKNIVYLIINENEELNLTISGLNTESILKKIKYRKVEKPTIFEEEVEITKIQLNNPKLELAESVFFDYSEFNLTLNTKESFIEKIKQRIDLKKSYFVSLYGFTDSIGTDEFNIKLSEKRIDQVKKLLLANFNNFEILSKEAKGIDRNNLLNPQFSRRVEIKIIEK